MLKHLAEAHPSAVAMLSHQYRMNRQICTLSNEIVYGGALKCANDAVAHQQLDLPGFPENIHTNHGACLWLSKAVHPQHPVIFLNTDSHITSGSTESAFASLERTTGLSSGGSIVNDTEVEIVRKVVEGLVSCGLAPSKIGVICPFRAQVSEMITGLVFNCRLPHPLSDLSMF